MRTLGIALVLLMAASVQAHENFSYDGDDCSAGNFHWNDREAFVEPQTIDGSSLRSLKASVTHAPISVTGGNARGYSVEVCKAAESREALAAIRVTLDGGELRATGPDDGHWTVIYRIRAPHDADLDVSAKNGPVSIRDVDGTVVARSANGPLSLSNVSGTIDATTTNGPISVKGGSGTMKVQASNGPLSIHLSGGSWQGGSLEASTKNGPLSVSVPRGYASGVLIESNGRGPISCKAEGCERFRAAVQDQDHDWSGRSEPRSIELGSGPTAVRLSTVNGPVTVKDE